MDENARSWRELSRQYSMCAGQFYEAVAGLGRRRGVDTELVAHWQKIKELHALCLPLEKEIDRYLGLEERQMGAGGEGQT